ncbi:Fungal specific transcription factor [Emydomyces testavorans]|uniref:Fungal specific transcription factor n=1 Tax=Emydomyces testavorans TaxID=2070801 RepID=A0AAF0DLT7_9EURO|nr:Fungal specific transcription factor [Emydomyces testavorans]
MDPVVVSTNQQSSASSRPELSASQPRSPQQPSKPSFSANRPAEQPKPAIAPGLSRRSSASNTSLASPSLANTGASVSARNGPGSGTCDACYRRKGRCAMNESVSRCYSCDFHRQECTFTLNSQLGKRKLEETNWEKAFMKRHATSSSGATLGSISEAQSQNSTLTDFQESSPLTTQYIGMTTELEPLLLDYLPLDQYGEGRLAASRIRKFSNDGMYMRMIDGPQAGPDVSSMSVEAIENLVTPFGPSLVEKFFQNLHPTFPVLLEDKFRSLYQARKVDPLLLASIYLVSLKWLDPGPGIQTLRKPDATRLESTALKLLHESVARPHISTIQAGLLLSQKSTLFSPRLMSQLVTAAFELGLHQDCSTWKMETWEKGLRKRLAWALYAQDKWCALAHGRPSHIFTQNWTVPELCPNDFEACYSKGPDSNDPPAAHASGPLLFSRLVTLTIILSDILDTFYTIRATQDLSSTSGDDSTRLILERAKPIQIRLKAWFAGLPPSLKMNSSLDPLDNISHNTDTAANGGLHLAYFATEITLHRCIIRSINPTTTDDYLTHICRSAAKTRLISAMDFVNRLRPNHLRAFWPAAARTNFALIVAFGMLLRITAQTQEEEEFYRCRLREYRWTLEVSKRHAAFLGWVVECLDVMSSVIRGAGLKKPVLEEFMAKAIAPPAPSRGRGRAVRWAAGLTESPGEEEEEEEDGEGEEEEDERGRNRSVESVPTGLRSPATSLSVESRRGSKSGGGGGGVAATPAVERTVMSVADLT